MSSPGAAGRCRTRYAWSSRATGSSTSSRSPGSRRRMSVASSDRDPSVGLILGSVSSGARWFGCLYGETGDRFLVGGLGVAERHPGVDLQRGAGRVSGVGLDQGVVDALGFEPGEQEVPEPVRCHVVWEPGRGGVAGEQRADAASGVGLLPRALEQVRPTGLAAVADVQRERLGEGLRKRYDAVLVAFALADLDAAGVQDDVLEADRDEFGDADAGVEQGLDQHDVCL